MTILSDLFPQLTADDFYTPAMMEFDGASGLYQDVTVTTSGNKITLIARVNLVERSSGDNTQYINRVGAAQPRAAIILSNTNNPTPAYRNALQLLVWNSSSAIVARLFTQEGVNMTGGLHTIFASYDGDAGTAVMYVDGVSEDVTHSGRVAPVTGTLATGVGDAQVGSLAVSSYTCEGNVGFIGASNTYLTNWSDFMDANGNPKALDESTWTEWGAQPLFWNEHGEMTNNLGSAGAMTKSGTIIVGKGGN